MRRLRSTLSNIVFYLWTSILGIVAAISILAPLGMALRVQVFWGRGAMWLIHMIGGLGMEVRGREYIPGGAAIVASKHQSAWDTVVFHTLLWHVSIVMKQELMKVPFFAPYCRKTGMIPIDRSGRGSSMRTLLRTARKIADADRPILIFPEGTRVMPGDSNPYLAGIAGLYRFLNVPVVPVALNSGLYWPQKTFVHNPGTVIIEFLEPIEPGLGREEFLERLRDAIDSRTNALIAEGRAKDGPVENSSGGPVKAGEQ